MSQHEFIEELLILQESTSEDDTLMFIYRYFDDLLISQRFVECDELLLKLHNKNLNIQTLLSVLTITCSCKSVFQFRNELYKILEARLLSDTTYSSTDVESILRGLE